MENRINTILELDNNEKYVVLNQAIYQDRNYYLVVKLSDDGKDVTGEIKICEEVMENDVLAIRLVRDGKLLQLLAKYFGPNE